MTRAELPWARIGDAVARIAGLHFPHNRVVDLRRGVAAAAGEAGRPVDDFVQALLDGSLSPTDTTALVGHLTVGETYFFRDPGLLAALRTAVLPELVRMRAASRRLRLWSAGCCTGEEAYTLAMLLRELIPDVDDWQISLLATDVNPRFLRSAQQGVYGEWSFRATPDAIRRRHFRKIDERRHLIDERVRRMVSFLPLNLCEDVYPSLATGTNAMDLILCRNVLMYFEPAQARAAVARLHAALGDGGWLAVAPCETSGALFAGLEAVHFPDAVLYRKRQVAAEASVAVPMPRRAEQGSPLRGPGTAASPRFARGQGNATPAAPASDPKTRPEDAPHPFGYRAKLLADQGRLDEALALCDRWIGDDKLEVAAHYLRALVSMELGDLDGAAASLQRCAYLAPAEPMVAFSRGTLERLRGRHGAARRLYREVLDSLAGAAPDRPVAYSDGLTAAQLAALAKDLIAAEGVHDRAA